MDAPYIHLLVNHFPIVLSVVGALAALLALFTRHRTTWTFALGALLLAALAIYPAFFTGGRAADDMKDVWFVGEGVILEHAAAAKWSLWVTLATGLVAVGAIFKERTTYTGGRTILASPTWLRALVAVMGVASAVVLGRTAWTAGYVVHKAQRLQQPPAAGVSTPAMQAPSTTTGATSAVTAPATADTQLIQPPR